MTASFGGVEHLPPCFIGRAVFFDMVQLVLLFPDSCLSFGQLFGDGSIRVLLVVGKRDEVADKFAKFVSF